MMIEDTLSIKVITDVNTQVKRSDRNNRGMSETDMYSRVPFLRRKIRHIEEVWDPTKGTQMPRRLTSISEAYPTKE
jgi:hypothetical protein